MQVITRCRNLLNFSSTQFASFYSTPIWFDKWKNKSKSDYKGGQQPSKNSVRIATRQKRSDTKRALKSLLYHYGDRVTTIVDDVGPRKVHGTKSCDTDCTKKRRPKSDSILAEKIHNHRMRRKHQKKSFRGDDDNPETVFQSNFGGKWYAWSFDSRNGTSQRSSPRFDWRETFWGTNGSQGDWDPAHGSDSEDGACNVGLPTDRVVLGLSPKGPLKMKDVKTAFHLSALKWHPDRHQGPIQAQAEEKFKLCLDAYKSLCNALSGP